MTGFAVIEIAVTDVIWREDLYPRFEPIPSRIQQYAESVELLPPIEINQRNELIDGYHRWMAHKKVELKTIRATVTQTKSDAELDRLMAKRNSDFGIQLTQDEKQRKARRWFQTLTDNVSQIADDLKVSERTVRRWLARRIKDMKDERDRQIAEMWLACYTEDQIAEALGLARNTVNVLMSESSKMDIWQKLAIFSEYHDPDWQPPLYNVWKQQNKTNLTDHFGNSEASFADRLLYMYTNPFDIVVDPFAGGGSTIDICKKRLRRYWVSDRNPVVERRDIRQHDILEGPPPLHKRWGDVAMLFLDPPYWRQAEGEYGDEPQNLANMELEQFHSTLVSFIRACVQKMHGGAHIAILMQPTQWRAPDKRYVVDHAFFIRFGLLDAPLKFVKTISIPYESQQANAQQVEWAKENRDILEIGRTITVWEVM